MLFLSVVSDGTIFEKIFLFFEQVIGYFDFYADILFHTMNAITKAFIVLANSGSLIIWLLGYLPGFIGAALVIFVAIEVFRFIGGKS